jgi:hypothetical protein
LLNLGRADIHRIDKDGLSALHWAALTGHRAFVRHLIRVGADVNLRVNGRPGVPTSDPTSASSFVGKTGLDIMRDKEGPKAVHWFEKEVQKARKDNLMSGGKDGSNTAKQVNSIGPYPLAQAFVATNTFSPSRPQKLRFAALYCLPSVFLVVVFYCFIFYPWYIILPCLAVLLTATNYVIFQLMCDGDPTKFVNAPLVASIMQSSIVLVILTWLFHVVPGRRLERRGFGFDSDI